MTPVEVLTKARALLVRDGWRQRDYGPCHGYREEHAPGPRCAIGAISQAMERPPSIAERSEAAPLLAEVTGMDGFRAGEGIPDWNDSLDTTKRQVLAAFTRAIKLAKKVGRK